MKPVDTFHYDLFYDVEIFPEFHPLVMFYDVETIPGWKSVDTFHND